MLTHMESQSDQLPACPECASEFTYQDGALLTCPMCGHEWSPTDAGATEVSEPVIRDAVGNELADGDSVQIVKDLKVKGASGAALKIGTKVRGIRLVPDGPDGHDIDARVPGFGQMMLKSSVVKKVT